MGTASVLTVIIPALNEEGTVADVVIKCLASDKVDQVIVIDNASTDNTAAVAKRAGAQVIGCPTRGLGHAIAAGIHAAKNRWVVKVDADITNFEASWLREIAKLISADVGMVKSYWAHEIAGWPETYFLIKPLLRRIDPRLASITLPISAIYAFDISLLDTNVLATDWAIDLDLVYRVFQAGKNITEIELPVIQHTERPLSAYFNMADEILAYLLRILNRHSNQNLLLIMAHADDAEIWAGGTIIKHLLDGGAVDIVVLFGGQARRSEAMALTQTFKRLSIHYLGLEENSALVTPALRTYIVDIFASCKPQGVITHAPNDPHPDHAAAARLTQSALLTLEVESCPKKLFYCNGYFGGQAHYGGFEADTFVDISAICETKYRQIANHTSQNPDFWIRMAQNMDILNGMRCGVPRAEAFRFSTHTFYQHAITELI